MLSKRIVFCGICALYLKSINSKNTRAQIVNLNIRIYVFQHDKKILPGGRFPQIENLVLMQMF